MKIIEYLCENPAVAEVILGLVQVLSPFIVLVITLHDERKQNAEFKKQEVKMQYLKECMPVKSLLAADIAHIAPVFNPVPG